MGTGGVYADQYLQDDGCIGVCQQLTHKKVPSLDLRGNDIHSRGLMALADLLLANNSITSVCLEWNSGCEKEGLGALCNALTKNHSLTHLDLRNNALDGGCALLLAKSLEANSTVHSLDLRWNSLGTSGGQAVCEMLSGNQTITHLPLSGNKVPFSTLKQIEDSLARNKSLLLINEKENNVAKKLEDDAAERERREQGEERDRRERERLAQTQRCGEMEALTTQYTASQAEAGRLTQTVQIQVEEIASLKAELNKIKGDKERGVGERGELEQSLASERNLSRERENKLRMELQNENEKWRQQIDHERETASRQQNKIEAELAKERSLLQEQTTETSSLEQQLEMLRNKFEAETKRWKHHLRDHEDDADKTRESHTSVDALQRDTIQNLTSQVREKEEALTLARKERESDAKQFEKNIEHEREMRAVESQVAEKAAQEVKKRHANEMETMRGEITQRIKTWEVKVQASENARAEAHEQVVELRQQVLKVQIENEEKFTKFESALRAEQETRFSSQLKSFEDRLVRLQEARDGVQAKVEAQGTEYANLVSKSAEERQQHVEWLAAERVEKEAAHASYQKLMTECNQLKSDIIHKDHMSASHVMSIEQLKMQREQIIDEQRSTMEQMLAAHGVELRTYEDKVRMFECEVVKLHQRLRKNALVITQLKADRERRETTVEAALNGLRHTLTEMSRAKDDRPNFDEDDLDEGEG